MQRPVYYFDPDTDYSISQDGPGGPWVFEFWARPNEVVPLRKLRCILSAAGGRLQYKKTDFRRIPGKPVQGKLHYRVAGIRLR